MIIKTVLIACKWLKDLKMFTCANGNCNYSLDLKCYR
jgi:hypothetical protein